MTNINKKILLVIIGVLSISCVALGICFKMTKGKPRKFEQHYNDEIVDKTDNDFNDKDNKTDDEEKECNKYELAFKSLSPISLDYSNLINKLDYSIMTRYYCYQDVCKNLEKQLLSYYKENEPNSKKTSGFADYYVKLSNGKLKETKEGKTTQINGIKNVTSVIAHFSVQEGIILFYLDSSNNLYIYKANDDGIRESKLLYKRVKDFAVFEGNDYISSILPSEGQNITIALHTLDNKFMISYYSFDKFIDIKNVDYKNIYSENGDFPNMYLSQSKNFNYEKHDNKDIVVKEIFITKEKLNIITSDDQLLTLSIDTNYCKDNYELYKKNKVKDIKYDDKNLKVSIKFDDNSEQTFDFLKKLSIN